MILFVNHIFCLITLSFGKELFDMSNYFEYANPIPTAIIGVAVYGYLHLQDQFKALNERLNEQEETK